MWRQTGSLQETQTQFTFPAGIRRHLLAAPVCSCPDSKETVNAPLFSENHFILNRQSGFSSDHHIKWNKGWNLHRPHWLIHFNCSSVIYSGYIQSEELIFLQATVDWPLHSRCVLAEIGKQAKLKQKLTKQTISARPRHRGLRRLWGWKHRQEAAERHAAGDSSVWPRGLSLQMAASPSASLRLPQPPSQLLSGCMTALL